MTDPYLLSVDMISGLVIGLCNGAVAFALWFTRIASPERTRPLLTDVRDVLMWWFSIAAVSVMGRIAAFYFGHYEAGVVIMAMAAAGSVVCAWNMVPRTLQLAKALDEIDRHTEEMCRRVEYQADAERA